MRTLLSCLLATLLCACGELPSRSVSDSGQQAYNVENGVSPLHHRTQAQNENRRMY